MADEEAETPEEPQKPAGRGKLKVYGAILAIVIVECVVAYLFLPTSGDSKILAEEELPAEKELDTEDIPGITIGQLEDLEDTIEFKLGDRFSVLDFRPSENITRSIDIDFYVSLHKDEQEEVQEKYTQFEHRIREEIYVILRSSDVEDLTEPALSLICRKVLEKVNRILGKPYVKDVIFDNYSYSET